MSDSKETEVQPAPAEHVLGNDLVQRLANSLAVFTKHYDKRWMDGWADDKNSSTFSIHTFGDIRHARKLIEEADNFVTSQPVSDHSAPAEYVSGIEEAMEAGWQFVQSTIIEQNKEHGLCGVWTKAFRSGWEAATRSALSVHAEASTDPLHAACEGIADDYMTSETHHPGWVLIPETKFNAIRAVLATAQETK